MLFKELNLIEPILKALKTQGYTNPTPIQEQSIPILLNGNDLLGCAQTGTGKTAAFAIPILQKLYTEEKQTRSRRKIKSLIVTPTRELAIQISDSFTTYGKYTGLKNTVIFGGVKQLAQTNELQKGVDILVATPGRLLDLINQGFITLKDVKYFVLDEADQMLDMGFIHDINKIIDRLPKKRQSLFFSATMPINILRLSEKILGNPEKVTITPEQKTAEKVEQSVYFVTKKTKPKLLVHILQSISYKSVLVFSRTKYGADRIVKYLKKDEIDAEAIHGNKSQNARQRALKNFKDGSTKILVATDIAARGIDISQLSLVINFDLPNIPETYVHRIGRTGRANFSGEAISFCDIEERPYLKSILKLIKQDIPVVEDHPYVDDRKDSEIPRAPKAQGRIKSQQQNRSRKKYSDKRNFRNSGSKSFSKQHRKK